MSFVKEMWVSYCQAIRLYATFSGRTSRRDYWMFFLCNAILMAILVVFPVFYLVDQIIMHFDLITIALLYGPKSIPTFDIVCAIWLLVGSIYVLFMLIPNAAISARRLHDINISGKWLWFIYIPLIARVCLHLTIYFTVSPDPEFSTMITIAIFSGLLGLIEFTSHVVFLTLRSLKGETSDNRFGPSLQATQSWND